MITEDTLVEADLVALVDEELEARKVEEPAEALGDGKKASSHKKED